MERSDNKKYLGILGAWALSFGCSVGWGSFVMPGTTFLPIAGPVGTAIGLGLGGLVMLVLAVNFHYLMNRYPDCGGIYTYTKKAFGYDLGFLGAWFMIITYIAIIWANATALPLIARTVLGDTFRFGYLYSIAGYEIYIGEIILSGLALVTAAAVCFSRKFSASAQVLMAAVLFVGVVICFGAALSSGNCTGGYDPPYAPDKSPSGGVFTIFALAPWAFVGFESITHSAGEAKFSLKKSFGIMLTSLITAAAAYVFLVLLAVKALPDDCGSWTDYIGSLDKYSGNASLPTFFVAHKALGDKGTFILGAAALGAIFTGLVGNYIALSRLMCSLADDGLFPAWVGRKSNGHVPKNAVISILAISLVLPFFGRTAISWIVDVTTVGATIAYALASASAFRLARETKDRKRALVGLAGVVISILFALEFLIPNFLAINTLSVESYLILTIWSILGFVYFRTFLNGDNEGRMGHSIVAWIVLLGLIIFTSSVWLRQTTDKALERSEEVLKEYYSVEENESDEDHIDDEMKSMGRSLDNASAVQIALICFSLFNLLKIYSVLQKREKRLGVEKALAEASSRAKTSFLSNMSHEIRTPMNTIIGLDTIALRDPDIPQRTREHLEKIGASADHLLGIINDILDMSRIESGRMVLKSEEFSFRGFLDQINIIINGQCQDKGLNYNCDIIGDMSEYYIGDDLKLRQIMINILGNAVKFTETSGSVTLTIEEIYRAEGICTLRFIVKDTGIGMDKEYIPKIFGRFSQEDATTTNKYGGSGLGLAITKKYVEMMDGEILVESEKGVGSVFTVTVKLGASDRKEADVSADEDIGRRADILTGRRVLIAEDIEQNAEILADILELEGIESEHAKNGREAAEMFRESEEGHFDAILMDVRMPEMDGLTAARMIRGLERPDAAAIPIIAMTANVFEEDAERSLEAGMDAHLFKPIEPEKMFDTMARLISAADKA
ncbi:amino acid permease [Ruminococcus albus]|uniref:Circadian input-output histidine kinase CikA n=1 Tax=Ruminococcus albus TaxID=1264 RepID=A0A1I1CZ73_RUMAL|nr:amino acid permease [Ruminococcus albus]SFB67824.1 His Kinase A (phospho-acceptor) domain-containing protein [Ruminococcus albus]